MESLTRGRLGRPPRGPPLGHRDWDITGYAFALLLWPRLVASVLQVAIGYGGVMLWRHWRVGAERVTVH